GGALDRGRHHGPPRSDHRDPIFGRVFRCRGGLGGVRASERGGAAFGAGGDPSHSEEWGGRYGYGTLSRRSPCWPCRVPSLRRRLSSLGAPAEPRSACLGGRDGQRLEAGETVPEIFLGLEDAGMDGAWGRSSQILGECCGLARRR